MWRNTVVVLVETQTGWTLVFFCTGRVWYIRVRLELDTLRNSLLWYAQNEKALSGVFHPA